VNKTGFSPRTCKRILDYLSAPEMAVDDISVGTGILLELGDVPEQSDRKFGALLTRYKQKQAGLPVSRGAPKTMVRVEHIRDILSRWLEGEQPIDIFSKLPTVLNSSRAIGVDEWRRGTSELTTWDTEFEKFCEFLQATVFEFLPWVLRGCALLSSHLPGEPFAGMINWNEMAEKYHRDSSVTQREDTQEETPPLPA
jgi:hypothetical protein